MRCLSKFALSVFCLGLFSQGAQAASIIGVKVPDEIQLAGSKLVLNGLGVRKKSIVMGITVNVYVGALYVEKKSKDPNEILNATSPKQLHMIFTHDVGKGSLKSAWDEGFEKNCPKSPACEAQKPQLKQLKDMMVDVDENDVMDFNFVKDKVEVVVKKKSRGQIQGADFQKTLLKLWIGEPANPEIKAGLLGTGPGV